MFDVSIIYVNYFTIELLKESLNSFFKYAKGFSFEIIVVDNSCSCEEKNNLNSFCQSIGARLLVMNRNAGFGSANNEAARISNAKFLYFINTDTIFVSNACYELFRFLVLHPRCGIAGSNLLTKDMKPNFSFCVAEKNLENEKKEDCFFFKKPIEFNDTYSAFKVNGFVSGASFMISKNSFDAVGGFCNRIFLYADEAYLCYRVINSLGKDIYNVPSSRLIHLDGGSFDESSEKRILFSCDGNYEYYCSIFGEQQGLNYLIYKQKVFARNMIISLLTLNFKKYKKFKLFFKIYKNKSKIVRKHKDD